MTEGRKNISGKKRRIAKRLTFKVCKSTECSTGTIAGVLDVITLGGLVDLGVELLLGPGVTVLTRVARITVDRVAPLVCRLDCGARGGSVLVLLGTTSSILVVMELRTRISLPGIIIISIEFDSNRAHNHKHHHCTDWLINN